MSQKYALFGGDNYYPLGGFEDFIAFDDSIESLIIKHSEWFGKTTHSEPGTWAHIVSIGSGKIVAEYEDIDIGWTLTKEIDQNAG